MRTDAIIGRNSATASCSAISFSSWPWSSLSFSNAFRTRTPWSSDNPLSAMPAARIASTSVVASVACLPAVFRSE